MKKLKRAISLIIALTILALPLASCGNYDFDDVFNVTVDGGNGEKTYTVSYELYKTVFLYYKGIIPDIIEDEEGNQSIATKEEQNAALKEVTEDTIREYYSLLALAEDYGITITEEDKQSFEADYRNKIQTYLDNIEESDLEYEGTKEEYAEELYRKSLAIAGTTPEYFEFSYYRSLLKQRLKASIGGDLSEYLEQSYFHYKQVVILYSKGDAAAEESARTAIAKAHEKLLAGEDVDAVITEYANSDYQSEIYFDAYGNIVGSASNDTVSTIVVNAIKALDAGETSDIMSGDESERLAYFAVYQRQGFDEEFICGDTATAEAIYNHSYVGSDYYSPQYSRYMMIFESYKQNTSLVPIDAKEYKKITINTVK